MAKYNSALESLYCEELAGISLEYKFITPPGLPTRLVLIARGPNTFAVKEHLKALGFQWEGDSRRWLYEFEKGLKSTFKNDTPDSDVQEELRW
jgi:hypothetical protein